MRNAQASFPSFGIDTVLELKPGFCKLLIKEGYTFAIRYLGGMSEEELYRITCSGLAVMPVTYSRAYGWIPSEELGRLDGEKAAKHLEQLNLPYGCTVWLDLEGCAGPAEKTTAWVNAWSEVIEDAGYQPGLYVGANPGGLDSYDLWKLPNITKYWRGCSIVPEPANRGFCNFQLYPPNVKIGGVQVDVDVICKDWKNSLPNWVVY